MFRFFQLFKKIKLERQLRKVEHRLMLNNECMLMWSHGEMGYRQTLEEIEELESERGGFLKTKEKICNELILLKVSDRLRTRKQVRRDKINKEIDRLVSIRDGQ